MKYLSKIFKITIFLVILIISLAVVTELFIPKDNPYYRWCKAPYEEPDNTIDILFIGSSHVQWGIDPNVIWKNFGISAINYAVPGLDIKNSYFMFKEFLNHQKPKVVVIDIFRLFNEEDAISVTNRLANVLPVSMNKFEMINSNAKLDNWGKRLDYYFPLHLYHTKKLVESDFDFSYHNLERGHNINFEQCNDDYNFTNIVDDIKLTATEENYLNRLILLAKSNNIKIVFIKIPHPKANLLYHKIWNSVEKYSNSKGIMCINFNKQNLLNKIGFIHSKDLANDSETNAHLNHFGAEKISMYLGYVLKNEFLLIDHRNDTKYTFLNDYYKSYIKLIDELNPIILASPFGNTLFANQSLKNGEYLSSLNRLYKLVLQNDGNLVVYDAFKKPLWSSNTLGMPVVTCVMQDDGNLVLYDKKFKPYWSSNTNQKPGSRLILFDDGRLVIYQDTLLIWANTDQK